MICYYSRYAGLQPLASLFEMGPKLSRSVREARWNKAGAGKRRMIGQEEAKCVLV
jgi:hypothetical protein